MYGVQKSLFPCAPNQILLNAAEDVTPSQCYRLTAQFYPLATSVGSRKKVNSQQRKHS